MRRSDTDKILYIQLIIARMGEKELMNWWNTDMAFEGGGGDFLERLLGDTLAPLAAAEGMLKAAHLKEMQIMSEMPDNQDIHSLFCPEPDVQMALQERLRYFKRYPESVPEEISKILDPKKDWQAEALSDLIQPENPPEFTGSSFGKEIHKKTGLGVTDIMTTLAAIVKTNEKGNYVLTYYNRQAQDSF